MAGKLGGARLIAAGFVVLAGFVGRAGATEGLWGFGLRTQGYIDFEPGNDMLSGPEIAYSNHTMASHSLQLKASYLTSRLEQVFRENIPKQDYFLFTPLWHFRRNAFFDPTLQLDLGYARYDREYSFMDEVDNDTWIAAAQVGMALNFFEGEYGLFYHLGYNFITPDTGLVFPGLFGVGFWKML
jgi:hypothetical protein